jgi:hypothetical protein
MPSAKIVLLVTAVSYLLGSDERRYIQWVVRCIIGSFAPRAWRFSNAPQTCRHALPFAFSL